MKLLTYIFSNSSVKEKPWLFFVDLLQVLLFFYVVYGLHVEEGTGLTQAAVFIISGFVVANSINKQLSVYVFTGIAIALIFYAFGVFSGAVFLFVLLACLIWLSLSLNIYIKIAGFLLFLGAWAFLRLGYVYMPRIYLITPFIGVLFMFRGISYLYYLKNHKIKGEPVHRLAYFLLFPNLIFTLFPIIDFKEFISTYLVKPYDDTRQKALRYLLRAVTHLILYRLLLVLFYVDESAVQNLPSLVHYLASAYLLILRLSGILHAGMAFICMFGYDLSPVFNYYFLGSSFTDLWRRINTYWRNFMQKVFFYPIYFKIKKSLGIYALPIATAIMFVFTWFFHNYQLFWVRGGITFTTSDTVFWLVLGLCITLNVAWLDYKARKKIISKTQGNAVYAKKALFILLCFVYMATLWSLWGSTGVGNWLHTLAYGRIFTAKELFAVGIGFVLVWAVLFVGHIVYYRTRVQGWVKLDYGSTRYFTLAAFVLYAGIAYYTTLNQNAFSQALTSTTALTGKQERGYYKQMMDGNQAGAWEVSLFRPLPDGDAYLAVGQTTDLYLRKLIPGKNIEWKGKQLSINSFGLRDKEYSRQKHKNTLRFVLLGGSYEFGSGVSNADVFENLAENELNRTKAIGDSAAIEILNFACGGYHLIQHVKLMHEKVGTYKPDVVLLFAHSRDAERLAGFMADLIQSGIYLEYAYLKNVKQKANVKQYMSEAEITKRLKPYMPELMEWAYTEIIQVCRLNHIQPVWVFLPATNDSGFEKARDQSKQLVQKLGYSVLDLSTVYADANIPMSKRVSISVSKTDPHPNAKGHQYIAQAFVRALLQNSFIFKHK